MKPKSNNEVLPQKQRVVITKEVTGVALLITAMSGCAAEFLTVQITKSSGKGAPSAEDFDRPEMNVNMVMLCAGGRCACPYKSVWTCGSAGD